MSLTDFIVGAVILDCSESMKKTEIIQRLLDRLAADGHLDLGCVPAVLDGVMRRESLGSTGIGRGVALPHTKHPAVTRRLGILGVCRPSVDFDSIDAEPVDLIFLILSPPDSPGYQSMRVPREQEQLNRRLLSTEFCDQLRQASSEVGLREILTQPVLSDW